MDNTVLSGISSTGDMMRTVHKTTAKVPVSLIDVGGTSTGVEAIIGDSTHAMPVVIRAGSTTLPVSLTTESTIHVAPLTTGSTIHIAPLTTASTLHIAPLTTATTIHVAQSGTWSLTTGTTIHIAPLTTNSTISVSGSFSAVDDAVFTPASGIGVPIMGFASVDGVTTGDIGVIGMTTNRTIKATLYDSTGGELLAVSTLSVTNNSTFPVQVTAWSAGSIDVSGSTVGVNIATEDDSVFTPSTGVGVPMMGLVTSDEVSTGDVGVLAMSQNRILKVAVHNSTGVELSEASVFNKAGSTVAETTTIKTSGGRVYGISGYNNTLNPIYVKLYNTTAAPSTSDTAAMRFILPASTVTGAAGFVEDYSRPVLFSTGIGIRITGGSILDGDTAVAATTASLYTVNVRYA